MIRILLSATGLTPDIEILNSSEVQVSIGEMTELGPSNDGRFWYGYTYDGIPGEEYHIVIDAGDTITETELRYFDFYEVEGLLSVEQHNKIMNFSTGGGIVDFTKKNEEVLSAFKEFKKLLENKNPNPIDYEKIKRMISEIEIPEQKLDISGISKGWNDNISKLIQSFDTLYKEPLITLKEDMEKRIIEKQEMIDELRKTESKNEQEIMDKTQKIHEMEEEMEEMEESIEDMTKLLQETEEEVGKKKEELKEKLISSLT